MNTLERLRSRDPGLSALRRSCRAGIVGPALFAVCMELIGNPAMAIFAAFGAIGTLLFVDFTGPVRERLAAQGGFVLTGAVFICIGTPASRTVWLAAVCMLVVAFAVLFAGTVSSVLASASTGLLVSFILPVALPAPASAIPERLAGWLLAGVSSMIAITVLWPAPTREPLRLATAKACTLLAERLRAEVDCVRGGFESRHRDVLDASAAEAEAAVAALRTSFFATPYRPAGLTTEARTLVRLTDQLLWLETTLAHMPLDVDPGPADSAVCEVKLAAADLLENGARHLRPATGDRDDLEHGLRRLRDARTAMERVVTSALPPPRTATGRGTPDTSVAGLLDSLEPGFRAQEMSYVITAIAVTIRRTVAARRRTWWQRVLGRRPEDVPSSLSSAQERAGAHIDRHSVWLHNSIRGAVSLGLAVLVAELIGVQHSFWVAFGTMAVLRSNALITGQSAVRALLGTAGGIIIGGGLILAVGSDITVFWFLLPVAVVSTGLAPAAFSFAAGQAGFTATLLILFTIIEPTGWELGIIRIEDVAIGCVVSVVVGFLFWPRGAGSALGVAVSEAFSDSARYLGGAIGFGVGRCDALGTAAPAPDGESRRAAAAARRLDDAFRGFLAERGVKHVSLADVTALITAVAVLRLTADAVLDLWGRDGDCATGDRTAARAEILRSRGLLVGWYEEVARALSGHGEVPGPLTHDEIAGGRLIEAVRQDLGGEDASAARSAVKVIWTADHMDAARRLQDLVLEPARAVAALQKRLNVRTGTAVLRHGPPRSKRT